MDRAYKEAKKRVKAKRKFYNNLISYVGVSILLIFINVFTSPGYLWFLWAIVPWGISLLIQGFKIALAGRTTDWEQKEIRRELRSMGKDPDDYIDDYLELRELEEPEIEVRRKGYKNSDLV